MRVSGSSGFHRIAITAPVSVRELSGTVETNAFVDGRPVDAEAFTAGLSSHSGGAGIKPEPDDPTTQAASTSSPVVVLRRSGSASDGLVTTRIQTFGEP
ncbi:hypothetical protein [Micromonospora phaseoli]|uniref:hypothetical protein n=1 Tax=Micromonospora phaseoli TaxID=1144548 RepID=UPI000B820A0D|nr:hypothetical protein [Micromonospora phaseoli]GIJ76722.1 hypothetical protein Xph01_11540 [Micromonospora phaseoli]